MRKPRHIAVIPDGNRRWAQQCGREKQEGYRFGLAPGLALLQLARDYGIEEITYYGFTTDNCKRPAAQYQAFAAACVEAVRLLGAQGADLLVVGDDSSPMFPQALRDYTRRQALGGGGLKVNFLVNYGWEWDLSRLGCTEGRGALLENLMSREVSRIDLVLRWGGMRRLSGLLPVQSVYADFYVAEALWPDFTPGDFYAAMDWYDKQDVTLGG